MHASPAKVTVKLALTGSPTAVPARSATQGGPRMTAHLKPVSNAIQRKNMYRLSSAKLKARNVKNAAIIAKPVHLAIHAMNVKLALKKTRVISASARRRNSSTVRSASHALLVARNARIVSSVKNVTIILVF
jgi:hypothetical protein